MLAVEQCQPVAGRLEGRVPTCPAQTVPAPAHGWQRSPPARRCAAAPRLQRQPALLRRRRRRRRRRQAPPPVPLRAAGQSAAPPAPHGAATPEGWRPPARCAACPQPPRPGPARPAAAACCRLPGCCPLLGAWPAAAQRTQTHRTRSPPGRCRARREASRPPPAGTPGEGRPWRGSAQGPVPAALAPSLLHCTNACAKLARTCAAPTRPAIQREAVRKRGCACSRLCGSGLSQSHL